MRFPVLLTPLLTGVAFVVLLHAGRAYAEAREWSVVLAALDSTSPVLSEARMRLAEARMEHSASRALPNPVAGYELQRLSDGSSNESEQTIGIHQPLGFLWYRDSESAARKLQLQSREAAFEEARRALIVQVVSSVVKLRQLADQSMLLDSVLAVASRAERATNARLEKGDISEYEAQRIRAELVEIEFRKLQTDGEMRSLQQELVAMTGLEMESLKTLSIPVISDPPFDNVDEAVAYGLEHRSSLQERQLMVNSTEKAERATKRKQLPDFGIGVAYMTADPEWSGLVWEADLEIPLWNRRSAQRQLARAEHQRAKLLHRAEVTGASHEINLAMERWTRVASSPARDRRYGVEESLLGLDRGTRLYTSGEFSAQEFVDALRTSVDALSAYQQLQAERTNANIELRRVTGLNILE